LTVNPKDSRNKDRPDPSRDRNRQKGEIMKTTEQALELAKQELTLLDIKSYLHVIYGLLEGAATGEKWGLKSNPEAQVISKDDFDAMLTLVAHCQKNIDGLLPE
jgi:hypothetical protein